MSMTAEQSAELTAAKPNDADAAEVHAEAPASGEQATAPETPAEEGATNEAEGQKPEGEQPEAEKKPEPERPWRAVEAAKQAQIRVAKEREQVGRDRERVQQYEQRLSAHFEQRTRELDARAARLKPLEEALERRDLHGLTALGFDFNAFAREALEANTPEGIAKRTQARIDKLEEERKQQEASARQQRQIEATRADANNLVAFVEDQPDACPELYAWSPERIAHEIGLTCQKELR